MKCLGLAKTTGELLGHHWPWEEARHSMAYGIAEEGNPLSFLSRRESVWDVFLSVGSSKCHKLS